MAVAAAAGPLKRVKIALTQHFFNQFPVGLMANLLLKSRVSDLLITVDRVKIVYFQGFSIKLKIDLSCL